MSTLKLRLRNFRILSVTTIALACFSNAVAETGYKVTDLGILRNNNMDCAMSVNNQGWTEIMAGNTVPGTQDSALPGNLLNGRALIDVDGFKLDLGTLGGQNTWMNWGEINDRGQIVGFSETDILDPNGEDVCGFGTHRMCLPFLWQNLHISALPTLGGNNGQASAINNHGQIAGTAETTDTDSGCPPHLISLPVLWEHGKARALPTVDNDPDGIAFWINDLGQAVGQSSNCSQSVIHAVSWTNGAASQLVDYGTGALAFGNNDKGQIVGIVGSPDGTTEYGALWQNNKITNLYSLPGDFAAIASGINNRGQVVGSTIDSNFNWAHGYIWQNGVMTDLNTLIPANSNLFITMANKINEHGQISGMGIVLSGRDAGNIHAVLLTPVNQSLGRSVAEVVTTRPKSNVPANVRNQLLLRFGLGRVGR